MYQRCLLACGATLGLVGLVATGCSSAGGPAPSTGVLSMDDFLVVNAGVVEPYEIGADPGTVEPVVSEGSPTGDIEAQQAESQATEVLPDWTQPAQLSPGDVVVIDSLVGQINGRPVYANAFFEPIDARLRIEKERQTPARFEAILDAAIGSHLNEILQSELLIAEAQSQLTTEQQQGLIAFLTRKKEDIISTGGGSREVVDAALRESGFGGIDKEVKRKRDEALIQMLLQQEVRPRVIISWRDLERKYNEYYDQINPPGTFQLSQIYLTPGRDDDKIESVKRRLAEGADFREVAREIGMSTQAVDQQPRLLGSNGVADAEGVIPLYRQKLDGLGIGETTEPFEQPLTRGGTWLVWLHMVDINQPPVRTLFDPDVQLTLKDALYRERFMLEQNRYFRELLDEGIYDDLNALQAELRDIASDRY